MEEIAKALNRIAAAMEERNKQAEEILDLTKRQMELAIKMSEQALIDAEVA